MAFTVARVAVVSAAEVLVGEGTSPPGGYGGSRRVRVRNMGPNTAYLGPTGVLNTTGFPLPINTELFLEGLDADDDLYARCAATETATLALLDVT